MPHPAPRFRKHKASLLRVTFAVACVALLAASASAEGYAYDLAAELMSPYCPGRTVASCPSPQAAELIQWISMQEAAGASEDEVVEMLIERFGEEILGAPPAEGITLWAYVFPVVGFLVFGGVAVLVLSRIVGGGASTDADAEVASPDVSPAPVPATPSAGGSDDELAALVDAELAGRR